MRASRFRHTTTVVSAFAVLVIVGGVTLGSSAVQDLGQGPADLNHLSSPPAAADASINSPVVHPGLVQNLDLFLPPANTVLDLCVDADAEAAGLDGGDLASERISLGLACTGSDDPSERYKKLDNFGSSVNVSAPDDGVRPQVVLGSVLHSLRAIDHRDVTNDGIVLTSLNVTGPLVTGLYVNSLQTALDSVQIKATNSIGQTVGSYRVPFAVVPGEVVPFAVPAPVGTALTAINLTAITGRASTPSGIDGRAIHFLDAPGFYEGPAVVLPNGGFQLPGAVTNLTKQILPNVAALPTVPDVTGYQTSLTLGEPSTGLTSTLRRGLTNITAEVAFLDSAGRVLGLVVKRVVIDDGDSDTLKAGDVGVLNLIVPKAAADVAVWGYGVTTS